MVCMCVFVTHEDCVLGCQGMIYDTHEDLLTEMFSRVVAQQVDPHTHTHTHNSTFGSIPNT